MKTTLLRERLSDLKSMMNDLVWDLERLDNGEEVDMAVWVDRWCLMFARTVIALDQLREETEQ